MVSVLVSVLGFVLFCFVFFSFHFSTSENESTERNGMGMEMGCRVLSVASGALMLFFFFFSLVWVYFVLRYRCLPRGIYFIDKMHLSISIRVDLDCFILFLPLTFFPFSLFSRACFLRKVRVDT